MRACHRVTTRRDMNGVALGERAGVTLPLAVSAIAYDLPGGTPLGTAVAIGHEVGKAVTNYISAALMQR